MNEGRQVSSQLIRNLIRHMHNNTSSQDRLKTLLHNLKQVDGCEVLMIQDDIDITRGIVVQTQAQKLILDYWGENLVMDFTHGTNNLVFHLGKMLQTYPANYPVAASVLTRFSFEGSLIATGATGRGIPVLDFLVLNEKADIMAAIFRFFKETNPDACSKIQTFVIDKHFIEWKVLERHFPNAKVLLCQFHSCLLEEAAETKIWADTGGEGHRSTLFRKYALQVNCASHLVYGNALMLILIRYLTE